MDDVDRELLRFAAGHRLISGDQVAVLARDTDHAAAAASASRMVAEGLLSRVRLTPSGPDCFVITEGGLTAIESRLPVPTWEMWGLRRVLAAGWLWVRCQDGRFGGLTRVVGRREMVSHDSEPASGSSPAGGARRPYGIRIAGHRPAGGVGLHHPDLLLEFFDGWAAVEITLGGAVPQGLAALLTAYGLDDRYGQVAFLVESERVALEIEAAAVSAGVASMVLVRGMEFP